MKAGWTELSYLYLNLFKTSSGKKKAAVHEYQHNAKFQTKNITSDFIKQTPKLGPRVAKSYPWRWTQIKIQYGDCLVKQEKSRQSSQDNNKITLGNKLWQEKKEQQDKI